MSVFILSQLDESSDKLASMDDSKRIHSAVPVDISNQKLPLSASRLQGLGEAKVRAS